MPNIKKRLKAFGRGMAAGIAAADRGEFAAGGIRVICPHCKGSEFTESSKLMNTAGMTFLNLDWLNDTASLLTCTRCSRIEWFATRPERL